MINDKYHETESEQTRMMKRRQVFRASTALTDDWEGGRGKRSSAVPWSSSLGAEDDVLADVVFTGHTLHTTQAWHRL